jgi:hypothetical protein
MAVHGPWPLFLRNLRRWYDLRRMRHADVTFRMATVAIVVIAVSAGAYILWLRDPRVVNEDHVVEVLQVAFLLLAACAHARAAVRGREAWRGGWQLRSGLSLFCVSLAVREVDIDTLGGAAIMPAVEAGVRAAVVIAWLVFAAIAHGLIGEWWNRRYSIAKSGLGMLTIMGCLFYAASWPFDKFPGVLSDGMSVLAEETLQLNATVLLLVAACRPETKTAAPEAIDRGSGRLESPP